MMLQRALGASGLVSSSLGLGCRFTTGRLAAYTFALLSRAIEEGVTLFDVSDAETGHLVGKAVSPYRDRVVLSALVRGGEGHGARELRRRCEAMLWTLDTDVIDL